jgi:hypothetical protein
MPPIGAALSLMVPGICDLLQRVGNRGELGIQVAANGFILQERNNLRHLEDPPFWWLISHEPYRARLNGGLFRDPQSAANVRPLFIDCDQ